MPTPPHPAAPALCLQRSGSSLAAIKKYIGDKYKSKLPANWEKMTSMQCKRMSDKGQLVKVRSQRQWTSQQILANNHVGITLAACLAEKSGFAPTHTSVLNILCRTTSRLWAHQHADSPVSWALSGSCGPYAMKLLDLGPPHQHPSCAVTWSPTHCVLVHVSQAVCLLPSLTLTMR